MESLSLVQPAIQGVICALVNFGPGVECCCEVCAKFVQNLGRKHSWYRHEGCCIRATEQEELGSVEGMKIQHVSNRQEIDFSILEWTVKFNWNCKEVHISIILTLIPERLVMHYILLGASTYHMAALLFKTYYFPQWSKTRMPRHSEMISAIDCRNTYLFFLVRKHYSSNEK